LAELDMGALRRQDWAFGFPQGLGADGGKLGGDVREYGHGVARAPSFKREKLLVASPDDNAGAHGHAAKELEYILVQHTDAAGGRGLADAPGLIGAMDAVQRVDAILEQIEGAGAERVFRAA